MLFPTDGSDTATEAAVHAIDLASRHDAALHSLYVVDHERVSRMAPKLGTDHIKQTLRRKAKPPPTRSRIEPRRPSSKPRRPFARAHPPT